MLIEFLTAFPKINGVGWEILTCKELCQMTAVETRCDMSKMTFLTRIFKNFTLRNRPPSQLGFAQFKPLDNGVKKQFRTKKIIFCSISRREKISLQNLSFIECKIVVKLLQISAPIQANFWSEDFALFKKPKRYQSIFLPVYKFWPVDRDF